MSTSLPGSTWAEKRRRVRRAAGVAAFVVLAGAAFVSMRSGLFARPVSAEVHGAEVAAGAGSDGIIDVPAEARSIQAAIDAAAPDTIVRIAAGTFDGGLHLGNKSILLKGAGNNRTFIVGWGKGAVIEVNAGPDVKVQVSDLTVAGGKGPTGTGVLVTAGHADIRNINFRSNEGSGVVVKAAGKPVIADCSFARNRSGFSGGAVCNIGGAVLLVSCTFDANTALTFGGAIYSEGGSVEAIACTFSDNFTTSGAYGGALYGERANLQVARSDFVGNESRTSGGAMYLRGGMAEIKASRFTGNRAEDAWAIYSQGANVRLTNSTLCGTADRLIGGDLSAGSASANNAFDTTCFPDCNGNGLNDAAEITKGWVKDMDENGVPDECDLDCNSNGLPDAYEISTGIAQDLNSNGVIDICEIRLGFSRDDDHDLIPDEVPARRIKDK